ncbi:CRISPR-associated endonuclease Cas1 [Ponticaulis sp.]|uniref:CRISPR-associated endonuclease Cas1 n=1 Tax=Ponticaulis sp. TaxID=2020902 RepID=UPI000B76902D|nr:CRISPR-associated endonuclease Cas1 [Ponticaulis sp.]MAI90564.1 CRISPR-associated endonuclease Cas1 [Ponticaulis sp.]OUX99080.1 MAG: CRISPR-associated endonuclease Cas1 [Hyphomonadaceae bacterium TMED5]|tara:strand:- start:1750 stop:2844 length:1095 start_codon:yes stop_codon:yes gene_type:complete
MADGTTLFGYTSEPDIWVERQKHWESKSRESEPKRLKRSRRKHPLILSGHNIALRIHRGALLIKDGFTHYPQKQTELKFYPGDLELPPRIILLDGTGSFSLSVIDWLREQNILLVRVNWNGSSAVTVFGDGTPTDPMKVKWQIEQSLDETARLKFATDIITKKLKAARQTLKARLSSSEHFHTADEALKAGLDSLKSNPPKTIGDVFAIEGPCAYQYFRAWQGVTLQWKGVKQYPIPPAWEKFDQRSSVLTGRKAKNWKATNPVNAMLNYGYAVLESELRIQALIEGYDPRFGILHQTNNFSGDAYIFDLMEPLRPKVDAAILQFIASNTFHAKDFVLRKDGVCRLGSALSGNLLATIRANCAL